MTLIAKGYIEKLETENERLLEQIDNLKEELRSLKLLLKTYTDAKKRSRGKKTTRALLIESD
jgi:cell division septum initiation protein DivIVA